MRPFKASAQIRTRCYSIPLQRVITDFGADNAFGQVPCKLQEHYGIEVPVSTIRHITEGHAQNMFEQQEEQEEERENVDLATDNCETVVAEIDGSMVPVVEANEAVLDKRKEKRMMWKEIRLSMAHRKGSVSHVFRATFGGSVDKAGETLRACAIAAGLGQSSHLHVVGDGAPWIAEQVEDKFGTQATYLMDFYHVCEYLAAAAKVCAPNKTKVWMDTQKQCLKNNDFQSVLCELNKGLQSKKLEGDKEPIRKCHQYLSKRINYLDYQGALEQGLPIGSGEIESAHRYIIQKRLKLAGAWWAVDNIRRMLALRILRANGAWKEYWLQFSEAA